MSESTVKYHLRAAMRKLGARDRTELVYRASARGLLCVMPGNRAITYLGPGHVEVQTIGYPKLELQNGPGYVVNGPSSTLGRAEVGLAVRCSSGCAGVRCAATTRTAPEGA